MKLPPAALLAIAFVVASGWAVYRLKPEPPPRYEPPPPPRVEKAALLAATLPDLDGRPQALAQWRGKILVANYWATWCPPCRAEMPGFSRLAEKYAAQGVQFVGISIDSADKIRQFQKETPVSYPLLVAEPSLGQTSVELGNPSQGLPFTAIFDRQGRLVANHLGRYDESALELKLKTLLTP